MFRTSPPVQGSKGREPSGPSTGDPRANLLPSPTPLRDLGRQPPHVQTRPIMHYPHKTSRIKRKRSIGFRARMSTKAGRKIMNAKRRAGRSLNVADK